MDSYRFFNFGLVVFHSIQILYYLNQGERIGTCLGLEIIQIDEVIVTSSENKRRRVVRS